LNILFFVEVTSQFVLLSLGELVLTKGTVEVIQYTMSLFLKASHMNMFLSCVPVAALICFSFSVAGANDEAPPNVLIIMTDEATQPSDFWV